MTAVAKVLRDATRYASSSWHEESECAKALEKHERCLNMVKTFLQANGLPLLPLLPIHVSF